MSKFRSCIDLQRQELQNAVLQNLPYSPSDPSEGLMYYDRYKHTAYIWNGSYWAIWGSESPSGGVEVRQFFLNLPFPRGNDDFAFVRVCENLLILRIDAVINAKGYLNFHVLSKRNVMDAGTPVTIEPIPAIAESVEVRRFSNPIVEADSWLCFKTMEMAGDIAMFTLTITCRLLAADEIKV